MATVVGTSTERWRGRARVIKYRRPWVYREQAEFLFTPARYSIVEASTKVGKTTGCLIWLNEKACLEGFPGWNGWWVAPSHAQAQIAYDRLKRFAARSGLLRFNDQEKTALYPNGAKLWFKSAEKPDLLYGDDVYAAVLDEATRMREAAWHAIRSTLTFTKGQVRIIGNVKGRKNWAYQLARTAESEMATPEGAKRFYYAKLTAWDAVNAGVLDRAEIEDAQRVLPPDVFNELYLAIPTEDGANPFDLRAIRKCVERQGGQLRGSAGCFGVDLAKSVDWTVTLGLAGDGMMAHFDRWQKTTWEFTTDQVATIIGSCPAYIDSTGVGDPIVERLQKGRDTVTGYTFTAKSKQQLMEGLALAIQSQEIGIWAGPGNVLLNELESFEYEYTRTGVRYSAPDGSHDDTVMALALAVAARGAVSRQASRGGRMVNF